MIVDHLGQQAGEIHHLEPQPGLAGLPAGDEEQVVDQPRRVLRRLARLLQGLAVHLRRLLPPAQRNVGLALDEW
jgi:hypothetical protein